ncbi:hypothetical protein ACP275_11G131900 [Erythranthe tilingii]
MAETFEFLRKSMKSYKYELASAIGRVPMQFILNHPYPPNSSVPIPHEALKDEKLLEAWPQIERQILEWQWYAKNASTYLPSPKIMLEMLLAVQMNGQRFPYPLDGQRHMQNFHQLWQIYDGKPTLDCGPEEEEELHMMQQFQQLQLHDKQQQPQPPPAWGTKGLMHIRMITALLPP